MCDERFKMKIAIIPVILLLENKLKITQSPLAVKPSGSNCFVVVVVVVKAAQII